MKLTIHRDDLLSALQSVQGVVHHKPGLPVLSSVLFRAEPQSIFLAASNLEVTITAKAEANVSHEGSVCIPAKRLIDIVSSVSSADLSIETDDKNVTSILAGESKFRIKGLPASDFIELPKVNNPKSFTIEQAKLKTMLGQVAFAMCADASRYILQSVFFKTGDKLIVAATDGKRLATANEGLGAIDGGAFVLPSETVKQVVRLLADGSVAISWNDQSASFDFGSVQLFSKLLEGSYPNYKQVIPSEFKGSIAFSREQLRDSIRRVAIMTTEKNLSVRVGLSENRLEITSNSPDTGDASEAIALKYGGPKFQAAYQPQFLLEALSAYQQDEVLFEFNDELSPAVFRVPGALCVIMPMRLN